MLANFLLINTKRLLAHFLLINTQRLLAIFLLINTKRLLAHFLLINTKCLLATFLLINTKRLLAVSLTKTLATKSLSGDFALDPWNFHSAELQREEKINDINGADQLSSKV